MSMSYFHIQFDYVLSWRLECQTGVKRLDDQINLFTVIMSSLSSVHFYSNDSMSSQSSFSFGMALSNWSSICCRTMSSFVSNSPTREEIFLHAPVRESYLSLEVCIEISIASTHWSSSNRWVVFRWYILLPVSMIKACPSSVLDLFISLIMTLKMLTVLISERN